MKVHIPFIGVRHIIKMGTSFSIKRTLMILAAGLMALLSVGCSSKTELIVRSPELANNLSQCVVLIHGLGRSSSSMTEMQDALLREGYQTVNLGYSSTQDDIETITKEDYPRALQRCIAFKPEAIHFVTHSLGGIILRKAFGNAKPENLGRVVMLSPPNKGSKLVDTIKDWWLFQWLMGPAGQQLTTGADFKALQLGKADFNLGIITGNRHAFFDSWFASMIPGVDDGKVSVENAKLEGMDDFLVTNDSHPFIMNSEYVQKETIHFLQYGKFTHVSLEPESTLGEDWYSQ